MHSQKTQKVGRRNLHYAISFLNYNNLVKIFLDNIIIILFISFFTSLSCFFVSLYSKPKFKAELRFFVRSEGTTYGLNGMFGNLGSFLGGNSMGSSLERTIAIASSDRIIGSALLSEVLINGEKDVLANILIKNHNDVDAWFSDSIHSRLRFSKTDTTLEELSFLKRKAIKTLESSLIPKFGDGVISRSLDKKSGVVTLSATHQNEEIAIALTTEVFNKLRDFYIEQMTASAVNNVYILQKKADSIKFELAKVQSSYARSTDQSFGLLFQEDKVNLKKLALSEQMLLSMYAEAQKNLETFKFMNESAMPSLIVIDTPYSPLKKIQKNKIFYTIGGFLLGGLIAFIFVFVRLWYKNLRIPN